MISIAQVRDALAPYQPKLCAAGEKTQAAVALLLWQSREGLKILFIERARHERDPWSGNIAFPGGRLDPNDRDLRHAAERETLEEIGLDLSEAEFLGRLDDVTGAVLPVQVACFVYHLPHAGPFTLNHEVKEVFWFPITELVNPRRHTQTNIRWNARNRAVPSIDLLGEGRPVLWGLTFRMVKQLLKRLLDHHPDLAQRAAGSKATHS
ncbi:CoA pyrophosphatase [Desulfuromonas sp. AOP6]|uniref:NUDIX hydrolase n=1 Tax=Desulfuromonas sp. AOP6 TaxID=1566351 RepID=UPI00126CA99C|nr:CoA pyrophosphatase [Desulfuromonas sp. AOP6]BCA78623.1 coenzyme A pyrophosphatase [Desulfuromonas sp. AOP6]